MTTHATRQSAFNAYHKFAIDSDHMEQFNRWDTACDMLDTEHRGKQFVRYSPAEEH